MTFTRPAIGASVPWRAVPDGALVSDGVAILMRLGAVGQIIALRDANSSAWELWSAWTRDRKGAAFDWNDEVSCERATILALNLNGSETVETLMALVAAAEQY